MKGPLLLPLPYLILIFALFSILLPRSGRCLHVQGTWETEEFFVFLSKFGFQKTESNNKNDTQGYVFGNITSPSDLGVIPRRIVKRSVVGETKLPETILKAMQSSVLNNRSRQSSTSSSLLSSSASSVAAISSNISSSPVNLTEIINRKLLSEFLASSSTTTSTSTTTVRPTSSASSTSSSMSISTTTSSSSSKPSTAQSINYTTSTTTTTTSTPPPVKKFYPATLVVLDRGLFLDFYRNRNIEDKDEACRAMFEQISRKAYDYQCNRQGTESFLRRIPCQKGELCVDDEADPKYVVKDHQFTYALSDPQPK
jgi:hypothetical protein